MGTQPRSALTYIRLSIVAAIAVIVLKILAWWVSGSVGLLSDALESFVNLAGASFAFAMIHVASTPPDEEHPFGHNKAEYFSSGFEGTMIFGAAALIVWSAIPRLFEPEPLHELGTGLWLSAAGTAINFIVSRTLANAAKRLHSVALDADARHLMTDVWTSLGVIVGLVAVTLSGWQWLDALVAIAVALRILVEGWHLMRGAAGGLMDEAISAEEVGRIVSIMGDYEPRGVSFSGLKTRRAGSLSFVHLNVLVPGDWRVDLAHDLLDEIEDRISASLHQAQVTTHLEPIGAHSADEKPG